MPNHPSLENKFKHFLSIQNDVIFFYERLADITTEKDLKKIFSALAGYHKGAKRKVEQQCFSSKSKMQVYLDRGHSFFYKKWKDVLGAVLVNDRKQLIEYCKKSELKLLEEIEVLISQNKNNQDVVRTLSSYGDKLFTYLEKLNHLPRRRIYDNIAA